MIDEKANISQDAEAVEPGDNELRQRRRMLLALALLLVALTTVLIKEWDFWFPASPVAESDAGGQVAPASPRHPSTTPAPKQHSTIAKATKHKVAVPTVPPVETQSGPVVTNRAVLPPLEVEVVAGDEHRTLHPGNNSVKLDLEPKAPPSQTVEGQTASTESPSTTNEAGPATNATERVHLSADTAQAVSRPVSPDYPLLARQMKVQGAVMLQALIGNDGIIQDLRVVSGPAILAEAARQAVKQWRFKPYLQDGQPVETQARITVNFTISTN
jgi:TonB family protein